jgi:hypothetical protein
MRVFWSALLFVVPPPVIGEGFQFRIGAQLYMEDQYDNVVGKKCFPQTPVYVIRNVSMY